MTGFEFNKIVAAILIALITLKGADIIANELVHPKMLKTNVFIIAGVETAHLPVDAQEKKGPTPIEPLLAHADPKKGQEVFKKCQACHSIEKGGPNRIGPDLYDIVGRPRGEHPGYAYSSAMEKEKGSPWTYEKLNVYLYDPRKDVPGTKMTFAGVKDDQERANLIAYLKQESPNGPPLPKVTEGETPAKPEEKPTSPSQQETPPSSHEEGTPKNNTESKT